ncbi:MAG TPA: GNAT family N-acetyltransferase [Gallionella sp.]|nr:GNAT family N-acetyltransferase [Gallionella sp.]
MNVIYSLNENHIAQLHGLYQQEWWSKGRSVEDTRKCVSGSQICIGIISETDELVGFARVLTDSVFKAFIFDVIVRNDSRGLGLGDKLLSLITTHQQLKSVKHFELYCLPEMMAFYSRHGFISNDGKIQLMRLSKA